KPLDTECVGNGIDDSRRRPDRARLPATLYSQRIGLAGGNRRADFERHKVARSRNSVIHEGRGHELAAVSVVPAPFEQSLADPLPESAMHLAFDNHWIDDRPKVVRGGELDDLDPPSLRIHLDLADMGPGRKREVLGVVERALLQARLGAGGKVVC